MPIFPDGERVHAKYYEVSFLSSLHEKKFLIWGHFIQSKIAEHKVVIVFSKRIDTSSIPGPEVPDLKGWFVCFFSAFVLWIADSLLQCPKFLERGLVFVLK